ncbi:MAG: hypothetical protein J6386_21010 [Candidatus Synoicihabitans palmerolidicus]|nr:hypothetical protein [Candidatus Synoicihabitans palmerolidicus]
MISQQDRVPNWDEWRGERGAAVTKIVLGKNDDKADGNSLSLGPLPDGFAAIFPNFKRLHLWNCTGFTTLPVLPAGLTGLDLQGCATLVALPTLPARLDMLDLGGRVGLSAFSQPPLVC